MPTATSPSEFVSVAIAGARYGVHPATIRRAVARGEIPAYRLGPRVLRVRVADLEAWRRPIPTADSA